MEQKDIVFWKIKKLHVKHKKAHPLFTESALRISDKVSENLQGIHFLHRIKTPVPYRDNRIAVRRYATTGASMFGDLTK
jgi:hypothetical protein